MARWSRKTKSSPPRAIEAVKKLHDAGILFGVTSGRPPRGMKMLIEPLEITEPIAGFNGGVVVSPDLTPISKQLLATRRGRRSCASPSLNINWTSFSTPIATGSCRKADGPHVAREAWTVKFQPTVVKDFDSLTDNVVKVTGVSDDLEAVARCEKDLQEWSAGRVSAARSQPYYLDVTNPKANKGEVVGMFSQICTIPPSEIATIGDMPNDVLMFKKSGVSIAMGNASPEVQKSATFVTASNEDEGFAKAMERLLQAGPAQ